MSLLDDVAAPAIQLTGNDAILVEVTNPESAFGGVVIEMPAEIPVIVDFVSRGAAGGADQGLEAPVTGAVDSVFGRTGTVVAASGDYTLDQIYPPVAMWTLPGKLRIKTDGSLQLWNSDQGKWHSIGVGGTAGGEYLTIGAGET
jgi:hypothetical protein